MDASDWGDADEESLGEDIASEVTYLGLPCPPSERTWRHPSELGSAAVPFPAATIPPDQVSRQTIMIAAVAGLTCAVLLAMILLPRRGSELIELGAAVTTLPTSTMGVTFTEDEPAWAGLEIGAGDGAEILAVADGSPGALAGLRRGDVITHIDQRWMASDDDVRSVLAHCHPGTELQVTVRRSGTEHQFVLTLTTAP